MTNFDIWEATDRFQRVLERSGITAELNRLGAQDGDLVTIADHELVWGEQEDEEAAYVTSDDGQQAAFEWIAEDDFSPDEK